MFTGLHGLRSQNNNLVFSFLLHLSILTLFSYSSSHFLPLFHSPPFPISSFFRLPLPSFIFFYFIVSFLSTPFPLTAFHFHSLFSVSLVSSPPSVSFSPLLPFFLPLNRLLFFLFHLLSLLHLFLFNFFYSVSFTASYFPYHLFSSAGS